MKTLSVLILLSCVAFASNKLDKKVFFVEPKEGAIVPTKFKVKMGVTGYQIKPKGDMTPQTGHHHLIIDADALPDRTAIPVSPKHIHFGASQTKTDVELPPGPHTLTLQFADGNHISLPKMTATIHVTVK